MALPETRQVGARISQERQKALSNVRNRDQSQASHTKRFAHLLNVALVDPEAPVGAEAAYLSERILDLICPLGAQAPSRADALRRLECLFQEYGIDGSFGQ